ncbi:hypothetical protein [Actinosynnema sp. ALI-1.44]|uniref:hypothetical protein n=1 Tax=Actinosynnema sp. ALI-1.44 TaxID=1933779 RepID=UPI00143D6103
MLRFADVDLADGIPIVDIKPYVTAFDRPPGRHDRDGSVRSALSRVPLVWSVRFDRVSRGQPTAPGSAGRLVFTRFDRAASRLVRRAHSGLS